MEEDGMVEDEAVEDWMVEDDVVEDDAVEDEAAEDAVGKLADDSEGGDEDGSGVADVLDEVAVEKEGTDMDDVDEESIPQAGQSSPSVGFNLEK